jgi:hypothetical protein
MNKKLSKGDKVRFIGTCPKCKNKIGKIVSVYGSFSCTIILPSSDCCKNNSPIGCSISDLELIGRPGKQLRFNFME